jgi:hypothetical protein
MTFGPITVIIELKAAVYGEHPSETTQRSMQKLGVPCHSQFSHYGIAIFQPI